jgi:hypothetical protein
MIAGNRGGNSYIWQGLLLISVLLLSGCGGGGGGNGSSSPTPSLVGTYEGQVRATDDNLNDGAEYEFTVASDGTISGLAITSSNTSGYPLTGMLTPGGALTLNVPQFFNVTGQVHLVNGDLLNGSGKEFNVSDGSLHDTVTFDLQRESSP